ncbi:hypothetical protein Rhe02_52650 [Rhizocola hellebori]|uniref:Uncharacterized protein n=1 Tax=Rhizocola hellebori TaxID=1392758 RepID=A0A8J3VIR4_9ACTN|nr:hypothetical protein [Rhizocola hellebori]GIH07198.1 hypothetical protein Rhe02_52650 [Rhizocola hellebori]
MTLEEPLSDTELDELEELHEAATPGPWYMRELDDDRWEQNAALIAVARSAVPRLIAEVRRLRRLA